MSAATTTPATGIWRLSSIPCGSAPRGYGPAPPGTERTRKGRVGDLPRLVAPSARSKGRRVAGRERLGEVRLVRQVPGSAHGAAQPLAAVGAVDLGGEAGKTALLRATGFLGHRT